MSSSSDLLRDLHNENIHLKAENQRLLDELRHLRQSLRSLFKLQTKLDQINPQTEPFEIINSILATALDAVNSKDGSLMLLDEETHELVFVQVMGSAQKKLTGFRLPPGEGIASWVVNTRTPKLVIDVNAEPRFSPLVDQLTGFLTTSLICVPVVDNRGALGAIEVVNTTGGEPFRKDDLDIMLLVARLASLAISRAESSALP